MPEDPNAPNYEELVRQTARDNDVDEDLAAEVARQESNYSPDVITGKRLSSKGAGGLMQLEPATASRFGVTNRFDPQQSAQGGTKYLKYLSDRYNGDTDKILAGYNWGEGNLDKHGLASAPPETRNYIAAIKPRVEFNKLYKQAKSMSGSGTPAPTPAQASSTDAVTAPAAASENYDNLSFDELYEKAKSLPPTQPQSAQAAAPENYDNLPFDELYQKAKSLPAAKQPAAAQKPLPDRFAQAFNVSPEQVAAYKQVFGTHPFEGATPQTAAGMYSQFANRFGRNVSAPALQEYISQFGENPFLKATPQTYKGVLAQFQNRLAGKAAKEQGAGGQSTLQPGYEQWARNVPGAPNISEFGAGIAEPFTGPLPQVAAAPTGPPGTLGELARETITPRNVGRLTGGVLGAELLSPVVGAGTAALGLEGGILNPALTFGTLAAIPPADSPRERALRAAEGLATGAGFGSLGGEAPGPVRSALSFAAPTVAKGIVEGKRPSEIAQEALPDVIQGGAFGALGTFERPTAPGQPKDLMPETANAPAGEVAPTGGSPTDRILGRVTPQDLAKLQPDELAGKFATMNPQEINAETGVQFKRPITDAESEISGPPPKEKYDPEKAGALQVYYRPDDGGVYIANGHHRLYEAKDQNVPEVNVQFVDAPDAVQARAKHLLFNIASDSKRAKVPDVVAEMKELGITPDDLKSVGIDITKDLAKDSVEAYSAKPEENPNPDLAPDIKKQVLESFKNDNEIASQADDLVEKNKGAAFADIKDARGEFRKRVMEEAKNAPNVTPEMLESGMKLFDAAAQSWSKHTGRPMDEWYREYVSAAKQGKMESPAAVMAKAAKAPSTAKPVQAAPQVTTEYNPLKDPAALRTQEYPPMRSLPYGEIAPPYEPPPPEEMNRLMRGVVEPWQRKRADAMRERKVDVGAGTASAEMPRVGTEEPTTILPKKGMTGAVPQETPPIAALRPPVEEAISATPQLPKPTTGSSLKVAETPLPRSTPQNPAPEKSFQPFHIFDVDPREIFRDPARLQFKQNVNAKGVTGALLDVGEWNPRLAGVVNVWRDPADGKIYAINGHHRHELAERLVGQGKEVSPFRVSFIDAATPQEARIQGALLNMGENSATASITDIAGVLKETGFTPNDLGKMGIALKDSKLRDALTMSKLDDSLYDMTRKGQLPENRAVAIAQAFPDDADLQRQLYKIVEGKQTSADQIPEIAAFMKGAPIHEETQQDLFGENVKRESLIREMGMLSAAVKSKISTDKRFFGRISDEKAATMAARGGNVLNVEANRDLASQADRALGVFDRLKTSSGPINDALQEAAREIRSGQNAETVKSKLYDTVTKAIDTEISAAFTGSKTEGSQLGNENASEQQGGLFQKPRNATQPPTRYFSIEDKKIPIPKDAQGLTVFRESDGKAVIKLFEKADASTLPHEAAHLFRRIMEREAPTNEFYAKELKTLSEWANIPDYKVGDQVSAVVDGKWNAAAEEKFGRGFERYLREGIAPTEALKPVFARFADWLRGLYKSIRAGSALDVNLSPEVKKVMDRLVEGYEPSKLPEAMGEVSGTVRPTPGDVNPAAESEVNQPRQADKGLDAEEPLQDLAALFQRAQPAKEAAPEEEPERATKSVPESVRPYLSPKVEASIPSSSYNRLTNAASFDAARQAIKSDVYGAYEKAVGAKNGPLENAIAIELLAKANAAGYTRRARAIVEALSERAKEAGQGIQILSTVSRVAPEGAQIYAKNVIDAAAEKIDPAKRAEVNNLIRRVMTKVQNGTLSEGDLNTLFQKRVTPALRDKILKVSQDTNLSQAAKEEAISDTILKQYKIPNLSADTAQEIYKMATDAQGMPGNDQQVAHALMMKRILQETGEKASWYKKLNEAIGIGKLLSPTTVANFFVRHVGFGVTEAMADYPHAVIDKLVSGVTGKREVYAPQMGEMVSDMWNSLKTNVKNVGKGVRPGEAGNIEQIRTPVLTSKLGRLAEAAHDVLIGSTPIAQQTGFEAQQLRNLKRAAGLAPTDPATPQMEAEATRRANEMTLRDQNFANKILSGIQKFPFIGRALALFSRAPGSAFVRSLEYSPGGIVKAMYELGRPAVTGENFRQYDFGRSLTRGLMGTVGLFGLGLAASNAGLIVDAPEDARAKGLAGTEGISGRRFNISGLYRLMTGGNATMQPGDKLIKYNKYEPWAFPFDLAHNTLQAAKNGNKEAMTTVGGFAGIFGKTVKEMPLVENLSRTAEALLSKDEGGATARQKAQDIATSLPGLLIPTISNEIRGAIDPNVRDTEAGNAVRQAFNKAIDQIPIASKQLPLQLGPFGQPKQRTGTISTFTPSPEAEYGRNLAAKAGQTGKFGDISYSPYLPSPSAPRTVKETDVTGKETERPTTPEERTAIQSKRGPLEQQLMKQAALSQPFRSTSPQAQASALTTAQKDIAGKQKVLPQPILDHNAQVENEKEATLAELKTNQSWKERFAALSPEQQKHALTEIKEKYGRLKVEPGDKTPPAQVQREMELAGYALAHFTRYEIGGILTEAKYWQPKK